MFESHVPQLVEYERREMLEEEECKFDKTGRVKGGAMHIHEVGDFHKRAGRRVFALC